MSATTTQLLSSGDLCNCVMTLRLFEVHLQTFLSTPMTQKRQILSCDVANERPISINTNFSTVFISYIYRIFSNLILTRIQSAVVFADFLNEKKKLVRGSNPHLSFSRLQKSRGGCRLHGKPSRRALSSDLSRSVA